MMKMKAASIGLLLLLASGATLGQEGKAPSKAPGKTAEAKFNPALLKPEELKAEAPATFDVKFTTTKGEFVVRVTREWAPIGADRFYNLVRNGFFDGAHFFRAVAGFVVQFGLSPYPEVTAVWREARIEDDPVKQSNLPGFITYAMGGPNTRTTQVYINLGENSRLDSRGFAPFGQVVSGMDVVEKLHTGYGDSASRGGKGPEQGRIQQEGAGYLDKEFPELDKIISAKVVPPAPAAPPKKNGQ